MPTQFETLLTLAGEAYRCENEVLDRVTDRAEKYVTTVGVVLAANLLSLDRVTLSGSIASVGWSLGVICGIGLLAVALSLAIVGMSVRRYATFPKTAELRKLDSVSIEEADAVRSAAILYLDIRDRMMVVNDQRARVLRIAGLSLLSGVLLATIGQVGLRI